jgi:predicted transcriptional regulator
MSKEIYHPNAYLRNLRNIRLGLRARTKILNALEKGSANAKTVAKEATMHYGAAMHHLKLLQLEGIVRRGGGKNAVWALTGTGQKRLDNTG